MFFITKTLSISTIIGGFIAIKSGSTELKYYLKMKNIATSKIKSLSAGEVEIKGKVVPMNQDPLISPLSKTKCVSYNLKTYILVNSKNNKWKQIYNETVNNMFYIKDKTGYILVDPEGATIRNDNRYTQKSNYIDENMKPLDKPEKKNKEKNKKFSIKFKTNQESYKFEETIIPENEKVYVLGYTKENKYIKSENIQKQMISNTKYHKYLITNETEEKLQNLFLTQAILKITLGIILIMFGIIELFNVIDWAKYMRGFVI